MSIIVTMSLSAAVWPQFSTKVSSYKSLYLGNGDRYCRVEVAINQFTIH